MSQTQGAGGAGPSPWVAPEPMRSPLLIFKRPVDVLLAATLMLLAAPVMAVACLAIRLTSHGPVIFKQDRVGLGCRTFKLYKFRTMYIGAEREQAILAQKSHRTFLKIKDDPRITPVGRLLRRFSLDELPQLQNVLLGDMSLIGPRPLLVQDFESFPKQEQMRRFSVRPGLTGLWQVSGRSECTDEERIALDLQYADEWSLGLDLVILVKTVPAVLSGRGAW